MAIAVAAAVHVETRKTVPVFILGDSTADVGTNNHLPGSNARADFHPNGIDFPYGRATGRFSNGFNSADFLAKLLGFKRSPPPFLSFNTSSALVKHSLRGINFASGGSGLLGVTGQSMRRVRNVVTLSEQVKQFLTVHKTLKLVLGQEYAKSFLSKSLFFISIGSNDIFGYFQSKSTISKADFIYSLGCAYETHLKNLYKLGARKFGIISIPPIGCCPSQRVFNETGGCVEELNDLAKAFHSELTAILKKLNTQPGYEGFIYSLGNAYDMTMDVILNPAPFKFKDVQTACCGGGRFNGEAICDPKASLCSKRQQYLFWDRFHPTKAASKLAAATLFGGGSRYVSPINFAQLAQA
ncbi:hypothetical protein CRG98_015875 [Punica granatum]|uniref:GDSL esterase/lipase At5g55050-like n=1 Tax=Punica granatum TaxID=22663 RepID=A0A2I0K5F0_PUNGR|nr:hypothetical protein CRG98_015875 [Punica granatum]